MARKKAKAKPRSEPEMLTIYADILQESVATEEHEGAILVNCGEAKEVWLPISQIKFAGERGDQGVPVTLPDWLADEKGLVDGQGKRMEAAPDDAQESPAVPAGEAVAVMENLDPPAQPETFTFKADVEHVYDEKYVLLLTNEQGDTASLEFDKDAVTFDGEEINVDLEEGYKGIEFTVPWDLAVEKHLPEFLGVTPVPVEKEGRAGADVAFPDDDEEPKSRPYRHKLRSATITEDIELSDAEKIAYGKDLVKHLEAEADYKSTASDYNARARGEKKRADKIVDILSAGREERSITCDVVADYNADQLVYVESEWPHREVRRERLTEKDRQLTLFDTGIPPAASQAEESAAPADAPEESPAETPQESKVFFGVRNFDEDTDDDIYFEVHYGDEDDTVVEFFVPREYVINEGKDGDYPDDDERRYIEISVAHAVELGIIEAPEAGEAQEEEPVAADGEPEGEPERSCGTCGHIHAAPDGEEPSPCTECGQDPDLPNWTDEYHAARRCSRNTV